MKTTTTTEEPNLSGVEHRRWRCFVWIFPKSEYTSELNEAIGSLAFNLNIVSNLDDDFRHFAAVVLAADFNTIIEHLLLFVSRINHLLFNSCQYEVQYSILKKGDRRYLALANPFKLGFFSYSRWIHKPALSQFLFSL
jgi:hypothetical protein